MIPKPDVSTRILKTPEEIRWLFTERAKNVELFAFDLETDSLVEKTANIYGIGLAFDSKEAFYIPIRKKDETKWFSETLTAKIGLEIEKLAKRTKLIGHNIAYDVLVFKNNNNYKIDLTEYIHADTMLMKHTVDEERPFGLKEVSVQYLGAWADKAQQDLYDNIKLNGGTTTKANMQMYKADTEVLGEYCAYDVLLTMMLYELLSVKLKREGAEDFFYNKEVMPLYKKATIQMKDRGLFIDVEYFKKLKEETQTEIAALKTQVYDMIREDVKEFVQTILDKEIKVSKQGAFCKTLLTVDGVAAPLSVTAKVRAQLAQDNPSSLACQWLNAPEGTELDPALKYKAQKALWDTRNPEDPEVFNLGSGQHMAWLLFEKYGLEPKSYSEKTNKPQVNKDSLESYSEVPFVASLLRIKKQEKILGTYIEAALEAQIDGWVYPGMLQHGTTSGRYSCAGGFNLQTLPRDNLVIKRGFVAPKGYKIVASDFSGLEARIFSEVSGDEGLKTVWRNELDLYSQIAIDVFGLTGVSADEKAPNYLKKVNPAMRNSSKVFTLAVPYGSGPYRIAELMGKHPKEAEIIIDNYLSAYPQLKDYMTKMETEARLNGFVKTRFGRTRHLPRVKELAIRYGTRIKNKRAMCDLLGQEKGEELAYEFKNGLNNAKNSPIQGTAAHVCNAAMIKLSGLMQAHKIDGWIALMVHDEIISIVREDQAELQVSLTRDSMENNWVTAQLDVPIKAEPIIANNLAEAK